MDVINNPLRVTTPCPQSTTTVTTGATSVVIKNSPGVLGSVLVTAAGTGTGSIVFYDSDVATTTNKTIIGTTITTALPVSQLLTFNMPANVGILVVQITNGPAMTISYT